MALLTVDPFNNLAVGKFDSKKISALHASKLFFGKPPNSHSIEHVQILHSAVIGSKFMKLPQFSGSNAADYSLLYYTNGGVVTVGFCFTLAEYTANTLYPGFSQIIKLLEMSNDTNTHLSITGDGHIRLGTITSTGDPVAIFGDINVWNYVEVEYNYDTRAFKVYVNDILAIDDIATSQGSQRNIKFGGAIQGVHICLANIYILDNTGLAPFNSRLGPIKTKSLPFNQITSNNWTTESTKTKLEIINNQSLSDVDTVNDPGTNAADMYTLDTSSLTETDEVLATVTTVRSNVTNYGTELINTVVSDGTNQIKQSYRQYLGMTNSRYHISETAPDGTAWDKTKLANTEFGYELS